MALDASQQPRLRPRLLRRRGRRRARTRAAWRRRLTVLAFLSPWLVGFSIFFAYPLVMTGYLSFTQLRPAQPAALGRPRQLPLPARRGRDIWPAVTNTLWIIAVGVPLQVLFAFGIAVMLTRARAGVGFFRTIFYLPALVPPVAATLGFVYVLNPATGPSTPSSSSSGSTARCGSTTRRGRSRRSSCSGIWGIGNTMIIFLAAVLDVPRHLYESAELDGAGALATAALGDASLDQPGHALRRRARASSRDCSTSPRPTSPPASPRGRPRKRAARARSSRAIRRARRSSTRSSSTTTGSATSTWATRPRWRCCCSPSRSPSLRSSSAVAALGALPGSAPVTTIERTRRCARRSLRRRPRALCGGGGS